MVFVLASGILNFRVEGFLAGKVFVDECLGNARSLGQFAGRRVGEPFSGEQRQGRRYDGLTSLVRPQSLIDHTSHASKLVFTYQMSTPNFRVMWAVGADSRDG